MHMRQRRPSDRRGERTVADMNVETNATLKRMEIEVETT